MTVIWPAIIMGGLLSGGLLHISHEAIPQSNHLAKLAIFKNFEESFYKYLKMEREFNNCAMAVSDQGTRRRHRDADHAQRDVSSTAATKRAIRTTLTW